MPFSRRTWLWTSTAALAAACAKPEATRIPESGPEGARELTRRGAENLIALAELGAAIRWLHPSDAAAQMQWEPLLLDGVRGLEGAGSRAELVEGLRGLFAGVAPTVLVWRASKLVEGEELDQGACPDPEAELAKKDAEAKAALQKSEAKPAVQEKPPAEPPASEAADAEPPADETSASEAEATQPDAVESASTSESPDAQPEDASEAEPAPEPAPEPGPEPAPKPEPAPAPETKPAPKPEPKAATQPDPSAASEERPPLHEALFAPDEQLSIVQWYRRGYADGLDDDPGCAQRVEHSPDTTHVCTSPRRRKRKPATPRCSACELPQTQPLAPAAPMRVELPRGLAAMVPLALWARDGQTLPITESLAPAHFGRDEALEYSLADRATRLLAVLRSFSLLQCFAPYPTADLRPLLISSLCAAAEDPSPSSLRDTIERLLAGFADGNAALIVDTGRAARRFVPPLSLAWVEQRVVVAASALDQAQPGDVLTAIDGVSIDTVLAEQLLRSPAASASAAIGRSVARLLERERDGTAIELQLVRSSDDGERELSVRVTADRRADRRPLPTDARPQQPIVELEPGILYVDATRVAKLDRAARRARRAAIVIIDLRGELADPRGSMLAHFLTEPRAIASERMPTGPDPRGALPLEPVGERRVEPERPHLSTRPIILADARTRGRAELDLLGFDQLGAHVIGSASAGDLAGVATAWLPGGWQLRFTHSELRSRDGAPLWGIGVRPTSPVEPTRASLRAQTDPLIAAALELAKSANLASLGSHVRAAGSSQ